MRNARCDKCAGEFQTNETLKVRESILCRTCAESIFAEEKIPVDQVQRQADPTVCIECGLDNGDTELGKLAGLPVCPQCEALFRNRPFPTWVKAALAGMVVLVAFALVWNSRFIRAYCELRVCGSAMAAGDFERGAAYYISASKRVPENADLQTYADYYRGILLLNRDEPAEALLLLESCRGNIHDDSDLDALIAYAKAGIAFDSGDYDEFVRRALEMEWRQKDDPVIKAQVASAYACKYAQTQDEQFKVSSLAALDQARTMAGAMPEYQDHFADYEQRILHRLHTREIIDRTEFQKRYPNGWTKEGEQI